MFTQPQLIRNSDGHAFELAQETTIGRRDDCSILLEEAGVSRFHAQINFIDEKLTIEDFSRNGTEVNGALIKDVFNLKHNDTIRFDKDEYRIDYPVENAPIEENLPPEPAMTEIAPAALTEISVDAKRKPLPNRPPDEGTKVVFAPSNDSYEPLDYRNFPVPSLIVRNGHSAGEVHPLQDTGHRWTIGSSADADITLKDEGVSSQHAVIQRSGNSWEVTDQMSTNVLRVNGNTTNKCYLAKGDKITLGPVDCEFVIPDGYKVREKGKKSGSGKSVLIGVVIFLLLIAAAAAVYFAKDLST